MTSPVLINTILYFVLQSIRCVINSQETSTHYNQADIQTHDCGTEQYKQHTRVMKASIDQLS